MKGEGGRRGAGSPLLHEELLPDEGDELFTEEQLRNDGDA